MEIHVVPVLLGGGARLFENTGGRQTDYECARIVNSPSVSLYKHRLKGKTFVRIAVPGTGMVGSQSKQVLGKTGSGGRKSAGLRAGLV